MADFSQKIAASVGHIKAATQAVFVSTVNEAKNSIQFGSTLTGSPGQPVANVGGGTLRASWQLEWLSPQSAKISCGGAAAAYAQQNEDGIARPGGGEYRLLANIGGRHSVRLTRVGIPRILEAETARLSK